jgi:hypothetical protein
MPAMIHPQGVDDVPEPATVVVVVPAVVGAVDVIAGAVVVGAGVVVGVVTVVAGSVDVDDELVVVSAGAVVLVGSAPVIDIEVNSERPPPPLLHPAMKMAPTTRALRNAVPVTASPLTQGVSRPSRRAQF